MVRIPVPKTTISGSHEPLGPGQSVELRLNEKIHIWKLKKVDGGSEQILIMKVSALPTRNKELQVDVKIPNDHPITPTSIHT